MTDHFDSTPSALRPRSYDGAYMRVGQIGEETVLVWLRRNFREVIDERQNLQCQLDGIDFRVRGQADRWITGEIKCDRHLGRTGRWVFELQRINLTASPEHQFVQGWSIRSKADRLCVFAPATGRIYTVRTNEYRRAFLEAVAANECDLLVIPTDEIKRTVTALFPAHYVEAAPSYADFEP